MGAAQKAKGTVGAPPPGRGLERAPRASRKKSGARTSKPQAAHSGLAVNHPRLVTRTELARIAGVSRMAITKATRAKVGPALVGDHIDVDHPAVAAYLASRGVELPQDIELADKGRLKRIDDRLARIERHLGIVPEDADA